MKSIRGVLLGSVAGLFLFQALSAATNPAWLMRSWQSDDGLPNNNVAAIAQTSDGYLWLGTPSGLIAFDGAQFQKFNLTNTVFGGNRGITLMLNSRKGGLWLAMNRGAVVYLNGARTKVFTTAEGLMDQQIRQIVEAGDGTLWVLFNSGGVRLIKEGTVTLVPAIDAMPAGQFWMLACDVHGDIWWVKGAQLGIYREGRPELLAPVNNSGLRLAPAKDGGMWICSGSHLLRCDAAGRVDDHGEFDSNHTSGNATALMEDSDGTVWIGTAFGGLIRYDGSVFENAPTSGSEIECLLEDREKKYLGGDAGWRIGPDPAARRAASGD